MKAKIPVCVALVLFPVVVHAKTPEIHLSGDGARQELLSGIEAFNSQSTSNSIATKDRSDEAVNTSKRVFYGPRLDDGRVHRYQKSSKFLPSHEGDVSFPRVSGWKGFGKISK